MEIGLLGRLLMSVLVSSTYRFFFCSLYFDAQLCLNLRPYDETPTSGVDENGVLRSLPLPNLSKVTRQSAKEYFDNSWTLFEVSGINIDLL